jgi:hypothetical protein
MRPYLEKPFTKIGLVEWLKVKALSSRLSTAKKTKQNKTNKTVLMRFQMGKRTLSICTRCWWLTPIILAIQEVEISRITV